MKMCKMTSLRKAISYVCAVVSLIVMLPGCGTGNVSPVNESYQYAVKSKYYARPSTVDGWTERAALTVDTADGRFYCFTDDQSAADDFVNAQRTLIKYLRSYGVEIEDLVCYGTDYGYSFSESSDNEAYIDLSDAQTWRQVLVTLQTVWGDYTDYGYVYAMANAVAGELGWQVDTALSIEKEAADRFFTENPQVIQLLYPTFTTLFASEETVSNSKTLALHLFEKIKWKNALKKTINEQLDDYYDLLGAYAQEISVPFERQTCGYAYYGEDVKLRIMTTYAELIIDRNYRDRNEEAFGDIWYDYISVYETANAIDVETTAAVEKFKLEEQVGKVKFFWLDQENDKSEKYLMGAGGRYYYDVVYLTSASSYLHEYYHHIECLLGSGLGQVWQSQAFCEIGASDSRYRQMSMAHLFTQDELAAELFHVYTGRGYQLGREDYFEAADILCHVNHYFELGYMTGESITSFIRYLTDLYGEEEVYHMMLYPDTVAETTGKGWEQLAAEWEQTIKEKYSDVVIPAELKSELELAE